MGLFFCLKIRHVPAARRFGGFAEKPNCHHIVASVTGMSGK